MSGKPYNPRGGPKAPIKLRPNATTQLAPAEIVQAYKPLPPEGQIKAIAIPKEGPKVLAAAAAPAAKPVAKAAAAAQPAAPKPPKLTVVAPELTEREPYVPAGAFRGTIDRFEDENPEFREYEEAQQHFEEDNPYHTNIRIYMPPTRLAFNKFIYNAYRKIFTLPVPAAPNPEACKALFAGSAQGVESFLYQKFIREYIRQASPFRGILVYHGLGSGKTCSAIAAAEALYGIADKKIIVMTPGSLRGNFINEISFCGFKHFQLNNHWVGYTITKKSPELLYMISVMSLSKDYVKKVLERPEERRTLWLPDFSKKPEEYNYKDLSPQDQSDIRAQINEAINNRITFVTYNGVSKAQLLEWACTRDEDGNGMFDNKVIVIDEVHNFVRNIQGKIYKYLVARPDKRRVYEPEPVTVDPWTPAHCGSEDAGAAYNRAILLYRLVAEARNSKVIGLSGTPIINFPEEVGILSNLLAGYIHCAEFMIKSIEKDVITKFNKIADADPRVDIIRNTVEKSGTKFLISIFPESYSKVVDSTGVFQGVQDNAEAQEGIREVFARVRLAATAAGIPIDEEATYKAYPRLPVDEDTFRGAAATRVIEGSVKSAKQAAAEASRQRLAGVFIDPMTLDLRNELVLKKRLTGLISYYKGSKDEYMPRIIKDEVVRCEMSNYVLEKYTAARESEMKDEVRKEGKGGGDPFAGVEVFSKKEVPSSYRFRSRATCNFAFPKSIPRPFPEDERTATEEIADVDDEALVVDAEQTDEDAAAKASVAEEEASVVEPEEGEEEAAGSPAGAAEAAWETATSGAAAVREAVSAAVGIKTKPYQQLIAEAMAALRKQKDVFLKLKGATEESSLRTYSPKLAEILERIGRISGSHLVYSQFKTVEGLGVLGVALEANGYKEIKVDWTFSGPKLSKEAEATILAGPMAEKRYITFTGSGSREERNIILNIFNGNFDKLPESIVSVFKRAPAVNGKTYFDTRNLNGEICKVIGITGAGAEGISLKCVRGVHIFEPYWNMVRLDQVKGRAVRICSHADLPVDQRTVEVFTYLSVFSDKQIKGIDGPRVDLTIQTKDKNMTSDEKVYNVCVRKDGLNKKLLHLMKEVAVDCELNKNDNEPDIKCSTIDGLATQYMFDPDLETDVLLTASQFREQKKVVKEIVAPGAAVAAATGAVSSAVAAAATGPSYPVFALGAETYIFVPVEGTINEYTLYESTDTRLETPIGRVRQNPRTGRYSKVPGSWIAVAVAAPVASTAAAAAASQESSYESSSGSETDNEDSNSNNESNSNEEE